MDKDMRREIIMDNYQYPFHKGLIDDKSYHRGLTKSDSCIDNIDMMIKVENGIVKDILFDGEACAICTSATSILIRKLIDKDINYVHQVLDNFYNMIDEKPYDKELLGELNVYEDLYLQPNRKNCALLPGKAVSKIIDSYEAGE